MCSSSIHSCVAVQCRTAVLPNISLLISLNDDEDLKVHDVDHYCEQTYTFQKELFTKIDSNIQKAQDQYKKNYDKKINQKKVM